MQTSEIEEHVNELETRIDRLRALYEQYFMGIEKMEPHVPRKDVDRRIQVIRREQIRNTALRFRFQMILQRYNTYQTYWIRVCREIEEGTYKRHVQRAKAKLGDPVAEQRSKWARKRKVWGRDDAAAPEGGADDVDVSFDEEGLDDVSFVPQPAAAAKAAPPVPAAAKGLPGPPGKPPPPPVPGRAPAASVASEGGRPPPPLRPGAAPAAGSEPNVAPKPPALPGRGSAPSAAEVGSARPGARAAGANATSAPPPRSPSYTNEADDKQERMRELARRLSANKNASGAAPPGASGSPPAAPPPRAAAASPSPAPAPAPPAAPAPAPSVKEVAAPEKPATSPRPFAPRPVPTGGAPFRAPIPVPGGSGPNVNAAPPKPAPAPAAPPPAASAAAAPPPQAARAPSQKDLSEERMRQIYSDLVETKRKQKESTAAVTYEAMVKTLKESSQKLKEKHTGRSVDFEVTVKDGKTILRPVVK